MPFVSTAPPSPRHLTGGYGRHGSAIRQARSGAVAVIGLAQAHVGRKRLAIKLMPRSETVSQQPDPATTPHRII
jgi:hypothetical protein